MLGCSWKDLSGFDGSIDGPCGDQLGGAEISTTMMITGAPTIVVVALRA